MMGCKDKNSAAAVVQAALLWLDRSTQAATMYWDNGSWNSPLKKPGCVLYSNKPASAFGWLLSKIDDKFLILVLVNLMPGGLDFFSHFHIKLLEKN